VDHNGARQRCPCRAQEAAPVGERRSTSAPPNKRLKLPARVDLGNESFLSAPQLKRGPLGGAAHKK
jgi:hypothetical protein